MFATNFIAAVVVLTRGVLGEGVHLLNCSPFGAAGNARVWYSLVAVYQTQIHSCTYRPTTNVYSLTSKYCENDADCSSLGYVIPSNDRCIVSTSTTPESFHTWEGGPQNCTFPTGITFGWSIPSNAQSQPDFSSVG